MSAPLLELRDVHKVFGEGDTRTVAANGIDLSIAPGEIVGLVGESGSGKSTVANLVLGLVEPDSGDIEFEGRPLAQWLGRENRAYRAKVQAVFQQPLLALDQRRTVGWSIAEPLVVHRIGNATSRRERVVELLESVGLNAELAERRPGQLSGGQLQRVNIARALTLEPRLLVCDEAVSALDVSVQAQVLDLFLEVQERLGVAMLFISHNMAVVRHISDSIVVMYHGDVVEQGQADQVCDSPRSDYARALIGSWLEPRVPESRESRDPAVRSEASA
ncbi:ABC transporter ATP-binding protein [Amnibacterium flavum]|uniref:Peptide ABC transporter ATP-binding protein n=1 Tax=Amnibacterium flavum TaxID=2173173 RepID=A0A2V1HU01_9MICO|nr:dipeptide/oligopeptide/nickel ABC transporter ATP-binding protein [Amnibacterium flavum]PVZ96085.1 peptide ABC transporter ATP-binding protein [Amnibacterium flavum]